MRAKLKEKTKAQEMRGLGYSIKEIAKILQVSPGSVSVWVSDIKLNDTAMKRILSRTPNRKMQSKKQTDKWINVRKLYQKCGCERTKLHDWLHVAGCMLYWGEGSKGRNVVRLTNSDPNMIKFFVRFLKECYNLSDDDIVLNIRYHKWNNLSMCDLKNNWISITGLPETSIRSVKEITDKRCDPNSKKKLPLGICQVIVYNTELVQNIFGSIKGYAQIDDEQLWLI